MNGPQGLSIREVLLPRYNVKPCSVFHFFLWTLIAYAGWLWTLSVIAHRPYEQQYLVKRQGAYPLPAISRLLHSARP
jgi:hypothetical protein